MPVPPRLHRLIVEGLYGTFNHDITFDPGPVTILHGPNGVGKTTLLGILAGPSLGTKAAEIGAAACTRLRIELSDASVPLEYGPGKERSIDLILGTSFSSEIVGSRPPTYPPARLLHTRRLYELSPGLALPPKDGGEPVIHTVRRSVAAALDAIVSSYGQRSAELSATYPHRLVERLSAPLPRAELEAMIEKLRALEERYALALAVLGISPTSALPPQLNDTNQQVLGLYIEDNLARLVAIERGLASAHAFAEALQARHFVRKTLELSHKDGLIATARDGAPIPLDGLSPGEQHQLLLLYVLFLGGIPAGTVLLVDEPEISLHPHWQERWMIDLVAAAKLHSFQAVVATHSPYIVGEFADSLRRLDGDD